MERAEAAITLVRDSADVLLLDPEGDSVVQSILVDEGTSAASAAVKDAIRDAAVVGPRRVRESLPLGLGQILLPLLPFEGEILPFLEKTHEESRAQDLVRKLVPMLPLPSLPALPPLSDLPAALSSLVGSEGGRSEGDGGESEGADRVRTLLSSLGDAEPEEVALIAKELRESLPRYAPLAGRLGGKVRRVCVRVGVGVSRSFWREERGGGRCWSEFFRPFSLPTSSKSFYPPASFPTPLTRRVIVIPRTPPPTPDA